MFEVGQVLTQEEEEEEQRSSTYVLEGGLWLFQNNPFDITTPNLQKKLC
jgi:hypothetical protein